MLGLFLVWGRNTVNHFSYIGTANINVYGVSEPTMHLSTSYTCGIGGVSGGAPDSPSAENYQSPASCNCSIYIVQYILVQGVGHCYDGRGEFEQQRRKEESSLTCN